jgi:hypothetical protein
VSHALVAADAGKADASVWWTGSLAVDPSELARALKAGWAQDGVAGWRVEQRGPGRILFLPKPNLVVDSGVTRSQDRTFGITTTDAQTVIVDSIGVDNGTVNPTGTTALSADGNSTSRTLIAMSPAATRAGKIVSAGGTFTQANVAFPMKRLFLNKTTTDASGNLHSMTNVFTIDLTTFSTWQQAFTATVTGTGS